MELMDTSNIISACALGLTIWQGWLAYDHNRRSLLPILELSATVHDEIISIDLTNHGLGPAKIKHMHSIIDDVATQVGNMPSLIELTGIMNSTDEPADTYFSTIDDTSYIAPSQTKALIKIIPKKEANIELLKNEITLSLKKIILIVDYESVYGDMYVCTWDWNNIG